MRKCIVPWCNNKQLNREDSGGITFHRVPKKEERRKAWIKAIGLDSFSKISKTTLVCSAHFSEDQFDRTSECGLVRLRDNAIPNIFNKQRNVLKKLSENKIKNKKNLTKLSDVDDADDCTRDIEENSKQQKINTISDLDISSLQSTTFSDSANNILDLDQFNCEHIETIIKDEIDIDQECIMKDEIDLDQQECDDNYDVCDTSSSDTYIPEIALSYTEKVELIPDTGAKEKNFSTNIIKDLESKCNKLSEENGALKTKVDLLTKLVDTLKAKLMELEKIRKFGGILPGSTLVDLRHLNTICRFCLQKRSNLKPIYGKIHFGNPDIPLTSILNILKSIGIDSLLHGPYIPDQICSQCVDCLKYCYTFKHTNEKSTAILKFYSEKLSNSNLKKNVATDARTNENIFITSRLDDEVFSEKIAKLSKNGTFKDVAIETIKPQILDEDISIEPEDIEIEDVEKLHRTECIPLICPICYKDLSITDYKSHIHTHTILKKFFMETEINNKTKFYALPRDISNSFKVKPKVHCCPFCQKQFNGPSFIKHLKHHLKKNCFACHKCDNVFKKRRDLLQHMGTHENISLLKCSKCPKLFESNNKLKIHHIEYHKLPVYSCKHCNTISTFKSLQDHISLKHQARQKFVTTTFARLHRRRRFKSDPQNNSRLA